MARKQAVILIHGIGEQRPMDTLRGFVDAVWSTHAGIHHRFAGNSVWSKPDDVSGSFELRRLVTPRNRGDVETHFYEFYWAHLMEGTSYGHVWAWAKTLLWRNPASVPVQLRGAYWILLAMAAAAIALMAYAAYGKAVGQSMMAPWLSVVLSLAILPAIGFVMRRIVGDAARYLHVAPTNVQRRHEIRQAGVKLVEALHDPARGYERIVMVGHSLGTVIGYDILTHAWAKYHREHAVPNGGMEALTALEALAVDQPDPQVIQPAQRRYFEELVANGSAWRVTDFVTVGSPLAHAEILLARDREELQRKQQAREFPTCLPVLEQQQRSHATVRRFSFEDPPGRENGYRVPHHAAAFAPTRWTNLYFPCRWILWGDLIGGPLREVMGGGIRDVAVSTPLRSGFLAHTLYWSLVPGAAAPQCVEALRAAIDLVQGDEQQFAPAPSDGGHP